MGTGVGLGYWGRGLNLKDLYYIRVREDERKEARFSQGVFIMTRPGETVCRKEEEI